MDEAKILTREELYELVWARPVRVVAAELGISDVGLAKICRRLLVPLPGLGYWARVQHGQKVAKPRLPERTHGVETHARIRPAGLKAPPSAGPASHPQSIPTVVVLSQLSPHPHSVVSKIREELRSARPNNDGIVTLASSSTTTFRTSPGQLSRALRILDAFLKAVESRGFLVSLKVASDHNWSRYAIVMSSGSEQVPVAISERTNLRPHQPKKGIASAYFAPAYDYVPTGQLTLKIDTWRHAGRCSWSDGKLKRLEERLGEAVVGVEQTFAAIHTFRAEQARQEREREECARRQALEAQRRKYREALERDLSGMAARWRESQTIREFLSAVAEHVPDAGRSAGFTAWFEWAAAYTKGLDPLSDVETIAKALEPDLSQPERPTE